MDLNTVCQKGTKYRARRRVGRGIGSGLGKTCGRGHKGWGARSGSHRRPGYEGGQMPIYRRVPIRGFTNARFRTDYTIINVQSLEAFEDGATVNLLAVLEKGLVSLNTNNFKVLGNGELTRKLTVQAHKFSKSAVEKIEKAGGRAVVVERVPGRSRLVSRPSSSGADEASSEARPVQEYPVFPPDAEGTEEPNPS